MGATFPRVKSWTQNEVVSNTDLNAEFNNVLDNLGPAGVDDYSTNSAQMRLQTSPGAVGSESLPTSLAGELERIRFVLSQIKGSGVDYWYEAASTSLTDLGNALGGSLSANRIVSGLTTGNSSQLIALDPSGTTTSMTLAGAATNFVYYINSVAYSVTASVTVSGLSAAPSSNNTCLVNEPLATADDQFTQFLGEYGTTINVDNMGTEITSLVGKFAAFSVAGSATEYFVAFVKSSTELTKAWRGCFVDSSQAAVKRVGFTDNDTITLLRLTWVFVTTTNTLTVTYTTPSYTSTEPTSPSTGDYWFDFSNNTWKTFNSTSWVAANATLIGICVQTTAACVGARTFDTFVANSDFNTVELEYVSASTVRTKSQNSGISIYGTSLAYGLKATTWDMASHLHSGVVEAASTFYYLYLKENGDPIISNVVPTDFRGTRRGLYHPQETWRCVACIYNNASSDFDSNTLYNFVNSAQELDTRGVNFNIETSIASSALTIKLKDRIGNYPSELIPTVIQMRSATAIAGGQLTNLVTKQINLTVGSAATLGHRGGVNQYIWVNLINDAGVLDLAVSGTEPYFNEDLASSVLISTAATTGSTLYSGISHSGEKPHALIARLTSNQTSSGVYNTLPSKIALRPIAKVASVPWSTYTPTAGAAFGTATNISFRYRRTGDLLDVEGTLTTGTVTGGIPSLTLPSGLNIDTAKFGISATTGGAQLPSVGLYSCANAGGNGTGNVLVALGTSESIVYFALSSNSTTPLVPGAGTTNLANSGVVSVRFRVPIAGWSTYGPDL
jgi:hypothetical protein